MRRPSSRTRVCGPGLLAASALLLLGLSSAHAKPTAGDPATCDGRVLEQPFTRWGDLATYVLVPNGTIEKRGSWTYTSSAARVRGNETFYVHAEDDAWSLALPPGSSATTDLMCVRVDDPTLRFFARNTGSFLSSLRIDVLFTDGSGRRRSVLVGTHLGSAAWQPTSPFLVIANLTSLLAAEGHVDVAFRFTPQGTGDWFIDDIYVDPFRHG